MSKTIRIVSDISITFRIDGPFRRTMDERKLALLAEGEITDTSDTTYIHYCMKCGDPKFKPLYVSKYKEVLTELGKGGNEDDTKSREG